MGGIGCARPEPRSRPQGRAPGARHRDAVATSAIADRSGIALRIGINSGPVVAGVIGTKRFLYDLWGDAVNIASRMETNGTPGEIQITPATYELLKDEFIWPPARDDPGQGQGQGRDEDVVPRGTEVERRTSGTPAGRRDAGTLDTRSSCRRGRPDNGVHSPYVGMTPRPVPRPSPPKRRPTRGM